MIIKGTLNPLPPPHGYYGLNDPPQMIIQLEWPRHMDITE